MAKRRIPEATADYARWLAQELGGRAGEVRLGPETSLFVAMALEGYALALDRREADALPFIVTAVDGAAGHSEVVAAADNLHIATAAFMAATIARPGAHLMLRHGVRMISERRSPKAEESERGETA